MSDRSIACVIFDLAGTTVDPGCFAPLVPFLESFASVGVTVTTAQARGPMGLGKREHLGVLARLPEIAAEWRGKHGSEPTEAELDQLYEIEFVPRQMAALERHSELVPGLLDCLDDLRRRGCRIAVTTGFFHEAAARVVAAAASQGFEPDAWLCSEDVPVGRPAPWMVWRLLEQFGIYPGSRVVKVGDTVPDIGEGRNAGCWSVGVVATGSEVGLNPAELNLLSEAERRTRCGAAAASLLKAGAHDVIDSVVDLPSLLHEIDSRLASGSRP